MGTFGFDDEVMVGAESAGAQRPRFALPGTIHAGDRNDTLFAYGCSLQARYRTDDEILDELRRANAERCEPPLPDAEVVRTAEHIARDYPKGPSAGYIVARPEAFEQPTLDISGCGINDKDLSRVFAATFRDRIRYVPEARGWYAYDGTRWLDGRAGGEQVAQLHMKDFVDRLIATVSMAESDEKRASDLKLVARYCQQVGRAKLLEDSKSEMVAHVSDFDADRHLFNCTNGTLDLRTGTFRLHDPADMLTKLAGCAYDDRAGYAEWVAFLAETFGGDGGVASFLQMCVGAALAGDTTAERFYVAYGPTRTGKSTTLDTILSMFGDYGTTIQPETLQQTRRNAKSASPDVARLNGMRFVQCPEPPKNMPLDAALVKQWTGGDLVATRHLFGDEFSFRPQFQLWVNTNYLPEVNDQTLFESGRVVAVPFDNRRAEGERDAGLKERMRAPGFLSAVLNWALDGYAMLGVSDGHIPAACAEATRAYATDSDRMGEFVADECEVGEGLREDGARLYERYANWAEANGCGRLQKAKFYAELARRDGIRDAGRGTVHQKGTRHLFVGIHVKE